MWNNCGFFTYVHVSNEFFCWGKVVQARICCRGNADVYDGLELQTWSQRQQRHFRRPGHAAVWKFFL